LRIISVRVARCPACCHLVRGRLSNQLAPFVLTHAPCCLLLSTPAVRPVVWEPAASCARCAARSGGRTRSTAGPTWAASGRSRSLAPLTRRALCLRRCASFLGAAARTRASESRGAAGSRALLFRPTLGGSTGRLAPPHALLCTCWPLTDAHCSPTAALRPSSPTPLSASASVCS